MNRVVQEDVNDFVKHFEFRDEIKDCSFLVTGATGLIGSSMIRCLLALNVNLKIIAPVRSIEKAKAVFDDDQFEKIHFIECDFVNYAYQEFDSIDYIIHCAAPTSINFFSEHPVETFTTILDGTKTVLNLSRKKDIKSMVCLSSLEVYGEVIDDSVSVKECVQGYLDPVAIRSCYPMAKRAAENLCSLYATEYRVKVKTARLTQTTGAGVSADDNRILIQFARKAAKGEDIVLHTTGTSARPYSYTVDAVSAILYILLKGVDGQCYNVANESTYASARELAEYVQKNVNPKIQIKYELAGNMGYAPPTKLRLNTEKLMSLGWRPRYGLKEIFERLVEYLS